MIISISGKMGSGKDTVGKIIQILLNSPELNNEDVLKSIENYTYNSNNSCNWIIKKFSDKLKDIICLLINCTREQLEDEKFKNTELGEDWNSWISKNGELETELQVKSYIKLQELLGIEEIEYPKVKKLTPRILMQLIGTEFGRNTIHKNVWVNGFFNNYTIDSKWIITDTRFFNEIERIKEYDNLSIRVNRNMTLNKNNDGKYHISEVELDNYKSFDEIINNDGSLEELIEKVKSILIKHKLYLSKS